MRFILTVHGESLVKVIEEEHTLNPNKTENKSPGGSSSPSFRLNVSVKQVDKPKSLFGKRTKASFSQTKVIDIHQRKLNIPKMINEKYNQVNQNDSSHLILPELPKALHSRNRTMSMNFDQSAFQATNKAETTNNSVSNQQQFNLIFPLKDVIQNRTYTNLKRDIKSKEREKEKMATVTENNFRSIYKPRTEVEDIEELLNSTKLDTGKVNLIQYLNSKQTLSDKFLKSLSKANDEKINRINKYCQIIANENEINNLRENLMKEKIRNRYIRDKNHCKELFGEMNGELEEYKKICKGYEKNYNPSRRERFSEVHKDLQKNYWSKYNVDTLQRRTNVIVPQKDTSNENIALNDSRKI